MLTNSKDQQCQYLGQLRNKSLADGEAKTHKEKNQQSRKREEYCIKRQLLVSVGFC